MAPAGERPAADFVAGELRRLLGGRLERRAYRHLVEADELLARVDGVTDFGFRRHLAGDDPDTVCAALAILGRHLGALELQVILRRDPYAVVTVPATSFFRSPLAFAALGDDRVEAATPEGRDGLRLAYRAARAPGATHGHWRLEVWGPSWPERAEAALAPLFRRACR